MRHVFLLLVVLFVALAAACREEKPATARAESKGDRRDGWIAVATPAPDEASAPPAASELLPPEAATEHESDSDDVSAIAPLADASPGEWARYRTHLGWTQQYRVTGVTGDRVSIEVRVVAESGPLGMPASRQERPDLDWALDRAATHKARVAAEPARIEAAGRAWDCRLTVARFERGGVTYEQRTWMSAEAPVYGLVKTETVEIATGGVIAGMTLRRFGDAFESRTAAHDAR